MKIPNKKVRKILTIGPKPMIFQIFRPKLTHFLQSDGIWFKFLISSEKRDVRAFPAKTSWGTTRPLICQAVNRIIPALLPWAAWPIRGRVVPNEVLAGNALTALFPKNEYF